MTVKHLVLLEPKAGVSDTRIQQALDQAAGLKGGVPGVLEVSSGKNFTDRAGNIAWAIIVDLDSKESLAGYGPHPVHQELAKLLGGLMENLVVVDYEI
jgi:hypothetical protein